MAYDTTGLGGGKVLDMLGPILDFKVISDNGGLLDCTLLLQRQQGEEEVSIRYWKNIAGQQLHEVTLLVRQRQLEQKGQVTQTPVQMPAQAPVGTAWTNANSD